MILFITEDDYVPLCHNYPTSIVLSYETVTIGTWYSYYYIYIILQINLSYQDLQILVTNTH